MTNKIILILAVYLTMGGFVGWQYVMRSAANIKISKSLLSYFGFVVAWPIKLYRMMEK